MDERFEKLDALLEDEAKAAEIFSGTLEESRAKLAAQGIEFTVEEYTDFLKGIKTAQDTTAELNEEDLEDVAGGCSDCYNHGKRVGKKVGRVLGVLVWVWKLFG